MADLRIMLPYQDEENDERMETDENSENTEKQDEKLGEEPSQDGQQNMNSFNPLGMPINDSVMLSPLDVTTPEELFTPMARLRCFTNSQNIFNRRMIAHDMCNILQAVQNDEGDFSGAIRCYLHLSEDLEPSVRVELMEQMCEATDLFQMRILNRAVVPILLRYLTDVNNQVRKACHTVLVEITKKGYLKIEQFEREILPVIKDLTSRKQAPDEYRTEAVAVVCEICSCFGPDFAKEHFLPIFLESCVDETMFHVRKVCAGNFSAFCDIFDDTLISDSLLPRFVDLCKDNVWGVRKACAENFPDFAKHASEDIRINTLSPLYSGLLSDQSRWVRVSAYESLGPFISTFADSKRASDSLAKDVSDYDSQSKKNEDRSKDESSEFDYFSYWREPLLDLEDFDNLDLDDKSDEDEDNGEIQSQVYVNSGTSGVPEEPKIVVIPTADNESSDSGVHEDQDSEYSPTKDDAKILKSIEFSADNEPVPNPFNDETETEQENDSPSDYDNFENAPDIKLSNVEAESVKVENMEICSEENEDKSGIGKEGLESGDASKEMTEKEENEVINHEGNQDSDDEEFDENEPRNWQGPSFPSYEGEIDYRIFSSSIYFHDNDLERREDQLSSFESTSSVYSTQTINKQDIIPQQLLDNFLSMTDPSRKQTVDAEIAKHCAFSIPGVAYTLGRNNWHCLKDVYQKLATDVQWKVRRTIASSIHELAKILGEELTATELVPVFNGFLKDLDDVRIGVLRHLSDFLQLLNPEVRGIYLYQLTDFLTVDNSRNWRFRFELARQLSSLIELYSADDTVKYICPLSMKLATDKVVAVQEESATLIATILAKLQNSDDHDESKMQHFKFFAEKIIIFLANSKKWKERCIYAKLCNLILRELFLPFDLFLQSFCPSLLDLSRDKIVNVRICAAKALSYAAITFCDEGEGENIFAALQELQKDTDRDVRHFAAF